MLIFPISIEYGISGEGSHISTNQNRENSAFSLLIGLNLRPFLENTVLYKRRKHADRDTLKAYLISEYHIDERVLITKSNPNLLI